MSEEKKRYYSVQFEAANVQPNSYLTLTITSDHAWSMGPENERGNRGVNIQTASGQTILLQRFSVSKKRLSFRTSADNAAPSARFLIDLYVERPPGASSYVEGESNLPPGANAAVTVEYTDAQSISEYTFGFELRGHP